MSNKPDSFKLDTELESYIQNNSKIGATDMFMYPDSLCALPAAFKDIEDEILNLEVRPDDVWVISFIKCGTTWTEEMVWMLVHDFDYEGSANTNLTIRFPFLEIQGLRKTFKDLFSSKHDPLLNIKNMKAPRLIKTHLPIRLLPQKLWEVKPKIIYVIREPKDVAVSYLNHFKIINGYIGSKEKFFEAFMSNQITYGSYWKHVSDFWKMKNQPNVLINTFEEMKKDLPSVIRRTAEFLGKTVPEDKMGKLEDHLNFSNMKNNDSVNFKFYVQSLRNVHGVVTDQEFINKGVIGSYKETMSPEYIKRFNDWNEQEKIRYQLTENDFPY